MSSFKILLVVATIIVVSSCSSKRPEPSDVVDLYFHSLQLHDSSAYLESLGAAQRAEWRDPLSASHMTFVVLKAVHFTYALESGLRADSSFAVRIVIDSVLDPRLQSTVKLNQPSEMAVRVGLEDGLWKVRDVRKT